MYIGYRGRNKNFVRKIYRSFSLLPVMLWKGLIFVLELIDDIVGAVDQTGERLIRVTSNVKLVSKKSGTCCKYGA